MEDKGLLGCHLESGMTGYVTFDRRSGVLWANMRDTHHAVIQCGQWRTGGILRAKRSTKACSILNGGVCHKLRLGAMTRLWTVASDGTFKGKCACSLGL